MKVAVYLRQSLDKTGLEAAVTRQREDGAALCLDRNWEWVEYMDNDTSAYNLRKPRPAYQEMLAAIRAGEMQGIVCWHPDRLYRHLADLQELIDVCNEHGVAVETVRGGEVDLTTPMGRLVARILGSVSMGEMEQKSDRQKRAARQRADQGRAWWPTRPFGFIDNTGKQLCEPEAAMIRDAYTEVLAGGALYSIAKSWNEAGVKTPHGNRWRGVTVRQLLLKPRNAALREYNGEIVGSAAWPAIVDENIYRAVVSVLKGQGRALKTTARKHLLSGLAICSECRKPLSTGIISHTKRPKYECKEPGCAKVSRTAEPIDDLVIRAIAHKLTGPEAEKLRHNANCENLPELQEQRRALWTRLEDADVDYKRGFINGRLYKETQDEIRTEIDKIDAKMLDADGARMFHGVPVGSPDVGEIDGALRSLPLERQRTIIRALMKVTILPGTRGIRKFDPNTVRIEPARPGAS